MFVRHSRAISNVILNVNIIVEIYNGKGTRFRDSLRFDPS